LPDSFFPRKQVEVLEVREKIRDLEADAIRNALDKFGWDVKGKECAARELGIGLRTLYRKLGALGTERSPKL
jgi:DNA-binding NtrC family response regulator